MDQQHWYTELENESYGITIRIDRQIFKADTGIQQIEIFENRDLGRVLVLDGCIMLTEKDEAAYHEMLVHPALLSHPDPQQILIIGGGDGGTLREVVKHGEVKKAVVCEIDKAVIENSIKHLPFTAAAFDSPRAEIHIGDGIRYVDDHPGSFDIIIVDSTDPVGMAEGLFRAPFYRSCLKALKTGGVFVQQSESPFFEFDSWRRIFRELGSVFTDVFPYCAGVPMYLSGFWTFAFASTRIDPWRFFDKKRAFQLPELRYYTPQMQQKAFCLPGFAERGINNNA